MKNKMMISFMLGIFFLQACKKDKPADSNNVKYNLIAMVSSTGRFVYNYDGQGRLISETFYEASAPTQIVYTEKYSDFNAAGNPTKINIIDYGEIMAASAEYDAQNRVTKITYRNESSVVVRISRFSYNGNKIEETANQDPTEAMPPWKWICQFSANGNLEVYESYNTAGVLTQRSRYLAYDDKKSIKEFYNPLMGVAMSKNNVTKMESTTPASGASYEFSYSYEYNEGGYITKRTTKNVTLGEESITTYEYAKK